MIPLPEIAPERLCEAWDRACAPLSCYRLDTEIVRLNLHEHPLFHPQASVWQDDAFVAVKRSAASLYAGPDARVAHLSLVGGEPCALTPLLHHAVDILRKENVRSLVVGTDSGHFLPGAPTDLDGLNGWLERAGFESGGLAHDLERDLNENEDALSRDMPVGEFRRMISGDEGTLDAFLEREFPGRWRFDVNRKVAAEGIETVFGLFVEGSCEGFALLQQDGCRLPIGGAIWRNDLGRSWRALGPIGISKGIRGRGLGNALLEKALSELRNDGVCRTIIDWTGLIDFYGAHGFAVTRSYRAYRLNF